MGEKNGNTKGGDGEKKKKGSLTVVLNVECLCEDSASKIVKYMRNMEEVEYVKVDISSNKVTVNGVVDPIGIKEKLEKKTKKKVSLMSPQTKKEEKKDEKQEKKHDKENNSGSDNKKHKQAPVTTADLKVQLKCQCQGCIDKIRKIVSETKGVHELKVDQQKELVTVKGTMDVKALAEALKEKLKKKVEIVKPKKEKDGNDGGAGKNKNKGGDGGNEANAGGGGKVEGNRMEVMVQTDFGYNLPGYPGYGQPGFIYGYGHPHGYSHGHPHPHGYGYHGYVPGYPVVPTHPPHHMLN